MRARLLYPGVSCEACRDIEETDGVEPQCRAGECQIPPLPPEAARAMGAWQTMNELREHGAGGAVLAAAGLSFAEVELVALIEREVRAARGDGPDQRQVRVIEERVPFEEVD